MWIRRYTRPVESSIKLNQILMYLRCKTGSYGLYHTIVIKCCGIYSSAVV